MHFNQIVYATLVILISVHLGNIFCLKSDNENKAKTGKFILKEKIFY